MKHQSRYCLALAATLLCGLLPVALLNYRIIDVGSGNLAAPRDAYEWQRIHKGIAAVPTTQEISFKVPVLEEQIAGIDAVVLGASSVGNIHAGALAPLRAYNFSTSGNTTPMVVAQAEEIVRRYPTIKWLFIALDWNLGLFDASTPPAESPMADKTLSIGDKLEDALTASRVRLLARQAGTWARARHPFAAFTASLNPRYSDAYLCHDGEIGRDFAADVTGKCDGYRWDGSTIYFGADTPLDQKRYREVLASGLQLDSPYVRALTTDGGVPNKRYLHRLAAVAKILHGRSGGIVAILPPLVPGLEKRLAQREIVGPNLRRAKAILDTWGRATGTTVIDASASERFGCRTGDFYDSHHSAERCAAMILARYRRDDPPAGIYAPTELGNELTQGY